MKRYCNLGLIVLAFATGSAGATELVAEYRFGGKLVSSIPGAPVLVPLNPLGSNVFFYDDVLGQTQRVYSFIGNATPVAEQAGFTLDTTGLVPTNSYSVEMVFKLTQRAGAWRRLLDVENRQSDNGFYVNSADDLAVFPIISGTTHFVNNAYQRVLFVVDGGLITVYLNGRQEFSTANTLMNINGHAQGNVLVFFADNVAAGGQGEYSSGNIALLRLYSGATSPAPKLSLFGSSTNTVVISWPAASPGWRLQVNTNLATANWVDFAGAIADDGTSRSAVAAPPAGSGFFRLVSP